MIRTVITDKKTGKWKYLVIFLTTNNLKVMWTIKTNGIMFISYIVLGPLLVFGC